MYTDQGPIVGKAAEVARLRQHIAPSTEIWADVMVKHATAPAGADAGQLAADTIERGKADAIVFSGSGTGAEPDLEDARRILEAVPEGTRIVAGSGTTPENLSRTLEVADTVIVGSSVKVDGHADNRVDPARAAAVAEAARENGLI
jgi:membrane complex biogenesis BtpA family protein